MEKRSHDEMERETGQEIICLERWSREKLVHLRTLILPQELKDRLDDIHLERGVDRVKVRYSTGRGDPEGRVYGTIIYYSDWYKKQLEKKGETFDYHTNYPRDNESEGGPSLQRMDKWIRRLLSHEYYHDYDIVNAAPILLAQIIKKEGLTVPHELVLYNTNREAIFSRYRGRIDLGEVKKAFLKVIHMGGETDTIRETGDLKRSLRATLLALSRLNEKYKALYDRCREACEKDSKKKKYSYLKDKEYAKVTTSLGKFCAAVWQREEHRILMTMREYFASIGYPLKHMVLCFDGLMVEKKEEGHPNVVDFDALSTYINEKTGFMVKIEEKPLTPTENDLAIYEGREVFEKKQKNKL